MALSHFDITAAGPKEKPFKLADGGGLHLLVQPNGNKLWRFRYEFAGVEKMTALGSYPATSLAEARSKRDEARKLEKAMWRIPAERTKMRRQHEVPLSRQAIAVLRNTWAMSDHAELIFPSIRSNRKPLSENAMNSTLRRMGYTKDEVTSHGFRATASTILNERGYIVENPFMPCRKSTGSCAR
jgi:integrase